ncbi:hypothetical protein J3E71DRAFT_12878 [Bipolaris maydis]|nr:hypothetical protein J3E71DRAFT_12878 [Bipolaris maydis]
MRASIFVSAVAFALASAQDSSSSADPFPQTSFTTETNSLGVVTGMPPVDTSIANQPNPVTNQPAVVTSQPLPANIPAVGPGVYTLTLGGTGTGSAVNQTRTVTVSANNSTTVVLAPSTTASSPDATGSGASGSGSGASRSGSGSGAGASATGSGGRPDSTGAASNVKVAAGSLMGFGAFMAAFL